MWLNVIDYLDITGSVKVNLVNNVPKLTRADVFELTAWDIQHLVFYLIGGLQDVPHLTCTFQTGGSVKSFV
jgi:hypothetical protein